MGSTEPNTLPTLQQMSDTPETDKAERMAFSQEHMVPTEFARQLERERNQLIDALKTIDACDWKTSGELRNIARTTIENLEK